MAHPSCHDVVFETPIPDPAYGLPFGDGDTGCLLWTRDDGLTLAVNKCDLWDEAPRERIANWAREEEEHATSLRHAGRLEIDFGAPVFDVLYQSDYEARMSLCDGCVSLRARTPFSDVGLKAFAEDGVAALSFEGALDASPRVRLSRWGSRTFSHWYSLVRRDPSLGLDGTRVEALASRAYVEQNLAGGGAFCLAAEVVSDAGGAFQAVNAHACELAFPRADRCRFTVYWTVARTRGQADAKLDKARKAGFPALYERHEAAWAAFWAKSRVELPDDYLENLWHLAMYYENAQFRGAYPPHFCNGLFGWQRDFVPWNYYFHYNMQLATWPVHAANHPELLKPYFDYRLRGLPRAIENARICGFAGALYTDVCDALGACDKNTCENLTPGAQIAMMAWKHWKYTGDESFLRDCAWPLLREASRLYAARVRLEGDGRYHIEGSQAYESSPLMRDSVTDHAQMRALFPAAAECAKLVGEDGGEAQRWLEIVSRLAPFLLTDLREDELGFPGGIGEGKPALGRQVLGAGRYMPSERAEYVEAGLEEDVWKDVPPGAILRKNSLSKDIKTYYGFPDVEFAPVYPSGAVGLSQKGTPIFDALVNQARLHPKNDIRPTDAERGGDAAGCMGWCLLPVVLARLGLADELADALRSQTETWQWYPNGLGHYGPYDPDRAHPVIAANIARDADGEGRFPFPKWPFRHFDFEQLPILAAAINEMLMQSHEGFIRLFPACPAAWACAFELMAEGGFLVRARRDAGGVRFAKVVCTRGGKLRLLSAWDKPTVTQNGAPFDARVSDGIIEADAAPGDVFRFFEGEEAPDEAFADKPENRHCKRMGRAALGVERMY